LSATFTVSYVALWGLVLLQGFIILGLTRMVHKLHEVGADVDLLPQENERLSGEEAPDFTAEDVTTGAPVSVRDLRGQLGALLFVSPTCPSCMVTLDELDGLKAKVKNRVIMILGADRDESRRLVDVYNIDIPVISDQQGELVSLFDVGTPPAAVLITRDGHIAQYGHPGGVRDIEHMLGIEDADVEPSRQVEEV
jgi:peroxiredoxin